MPGHRGRSLQPGTGQWSAASVRLAVLSLTPPDINELKVFVDLASISAGENDIDVDRVACFHDAVQGYASLLYKVDGSADFHAFMPHLQELWKALENDRHLPDKLASLTPP